MSKFYKYQFSTKKELKTALELLVLPEVIESDEEQPKPTLAYWSIVNLGVMYMTGKIAVDVLWKSDEVEAWEPFRIYLGEFPSSHEYAGRSYSEDKDKSEKKKTKKIKIKKGREDWKTKKNED